MSEYIVDAEYECDDLMHSFVERITRCRDCKYFEHCRLQMISNKPDGFCAWGEPKEGE